MEGVLTPEIWIAVAEKTGIPELRRTTRDEPDYDKLQQELSGAQPASQRASSEDDDVEDDYARWERSSG